jgi:hypothetical protein
VSYGAAGVRGERQQHGGVAGVLEDRILSAGMSQGVWWMLSIEGNQVFTACVRPVGKMDDT